MSEILDTTKCVVWDINDGSSDYQSLLLSVLYQLCGNGDSNIIKIDSAIKTLKDRVIFVNSKSELPIEGKTDVIYIMKSNDIDDENNLTMKSGIYIWNGEEYKYVNEFDGNEIPYDNTNSKLNATKLQSAIDELVELNKNNVKSCGDYENEKTYKKNDMFKYNGSVYVTETDFTSTQVPDFSKVYIISPKQYDHFTMEIDANINSNPSVGNGGIKYSGGCEGFTQQDWVDWLGYKPCIMYEQGGIEDYLNPNDYTKNTKGELVDITSPNTSKGSTRNVMVRYPRIGLQSQQIKAGKWIIKCTNDPCDNRYSYNAFLNGKRKFGCMFVGAYNGSVLDGKLHSLSNTDVMSQNQTLKSYRALANANGMFYNVLDLKKITFLQHLYILQNSTINGILMSSYDTSNLKTGFYNTIGLNKNDTSTKLGKFLGLETNGFSEVIDGVYVDSNYRLKVSNNDLYNNDATGYDDCGKVYSVGAGYIGNNVSFDVDCGIFANINNGTSTTGFRCPTTKIINSTIMNMNMTNIFNYEFKSNATTQFNGCTARLSYLAI